MPDKTTEVARRNSLDVDNPVGHVQDLSKDAVALASSPLAVTDPHSEEVTKGALRGGVAGGGKGVAYNKIKYNARKDKFLRCAADDTLHRHAETLAVDEPTIFECCGTIPQGAPQGTEGRKCVPGLSKPRVDELVAHMKPLSMRNKGVGVRMPGEIETIRIVQSGRMEFELNRLRLLRSRRMAVLLGFDKSGTGAFGRDDARTVLTKLCAPRPELEKAFERTLPPVGSASLSADALVELIGSVDKMLGNLAFEQADKDASGALDADEILTLLNKQSTQVKATMSDVLVLFASCDVDGSGAIESEELRMLLDDWREMAAKKKSSMCALL